VKRVTLQDIQNSGTYLATIKKGSKLVEISTDEIYVLPKDISVQVYREADYQGDRYLLTQEGNILYKTNAFNLVSIEAVTDLGAKPESYQPIPQKEKINYFDKKIDLTLDFSFLGGLSQAEYAKNVIKSKGKNFATSALYGLGLYANWDFPVTIGMQVYYETMEMEAKSGRYYSEGLSIGPALKSKTIFIKNEPHFLTAQLRWSLFSRAQLMMQETEQDYQFSDTGLLLGFIKPFSYRGGESSVIFSWERKWRKTFNIQNDISIDPQDDQEDHFMLGLVHGIDL